MARDINDVVTMMFTTRSGGAWMGPGLSRLRHPSDWSSFAFGAMVVSSATVHASSYHSGDPRLVRGRFPGLSPFC